MDLNEQQNNDKSHDNGEQPTSSYMHVDNSWESPAPLNSQPPRKRNRLAAGGLIAIFVVVVLLFSGLTGGLVYTFMNSNRVPAPTTAATTTSQPTSPETTSPSKSLPSTGKHYTLADAATRKDGKALSLVAIAAQGKPAVVAINTEVSMQDMFGQTANYSAAGSGFIISKDGYIVTNNHVIADATTITVVLDNGLIFDAELVGADARNDIAVIKIEAEDLPMVILGYSADLEVGELAVAIGNPLGQLSGTVTAGIISALDREINLEGQALRLLQTDAAINSGNSGGALFNSFGEVIGINTAKNASTGVEGLGFAIPIDRAKPIIDSLIQYGYVRGRTKIGIMTRDITEQMAEYYSMTEGIYIYEVEAGSAAHKAGIKNEDVIIAVDGQQMLTTSALSDYKEKLSPGDTIRLTIIRKDKQMEIDLVLLEEKPTENSPASSYSDKGGTI